MMTYACTCGDGHCMLCDDNGNQRHVKVSRDPTVNWSNDDLQFARLLAELHGFVTLEQLEEVALSMDLSVEQVEGLFFRAISAWEQIKNQLP